MEKLLQMEGIDKQFSGTPVLKGVDFDLNHGEVHALIGENGAGKSTLIKCLAGVHQPDAGKILIEGKQAEIKNTKDAFALGISTIHQEFNLVPFLSVASNIFLGRELRNKAGIIDGQKQEEHTKELLDRVGAEILPGALIKDLGVAEKQMVEIAKSLSLNAKVVIMDEPTAVLSGKEIDKLFAIIRSLKKDGISIIYISHRLEELPQIGDRVSVLRDGVITGCLRKDEMSKDVITRMMIGRDLKEQFPHNTKEIGPVVLEVKNLNHGKQVKDVSFCLHRGEILGFAGLVGSGRTEVARAFLGIDKKDSGEVLLDNKPVNIRSPKRAREMGLVIVPEERKADGLVLSLSIEENISLPYLRDVSKGVVISDKLAADKSKGLVEKMNIKPDKISIRTKNLSGGNQQKVVIAKWVSREHKVMVFDEPTRGVDVGAKAEIYKIMMDLAKKGVAILMISSDLPEIIGMSDRVLVMKEGRISGEVLKSDFSEHEILKYAF